MGDDGTGSAPHVAQLPESIERDMLTEQHRLDTRSARHRGVEHRARGLVHSIDVVEERDAERCLRCRDAVADSIGQVVPDLAVPVGAGQLGPGAPRPRVRFTQGVARAVVREPVAGLVPEDPARREVTQQPS